MGVTKGDTRSLNYSSYVLLGALSCLVLPVAVESSCTEDKTGAPMLLNILV